MPDDPPPQIPDLTLLRRIGSGSYGDVWIARTLTGVYRAVKLVDRARFPDDRPFQRELEGITRFQRTVGDQPRQLALMHVGRLEAQGLLYYVMELADDVATGTDIDPTRYEPLTLKALRARQPVLPAADCVRLGVELVRGLAGLHAAGLIHRDVKPSNVILVGGVPKLADIGLVSSREASVTSLGTPGYSPPEGSGTISADLWGLGRILYELVTGLSTREFPRLPPDFQRRPDATVLLELNEVVLRACDPDPAARYASAQEMLDDLLLIQAGRSVQNLNRLRARLKFLGRAAAVAGLVALVAIFGLGVKNYLTLRELAAQETAVRRAAEYAANVNLAQFAINNGEPGLARMALRREIPAPGEADLRGPEWRALWNDTVGDADRVFGEVGADAVWSLALSGDGRLVAAQEGESSRRTVLWDRATGARRVVADGTIRLGGFTADNTRLIAGIAGGGVGLIDVATATLEPVGGIGSGLFLQGAGDGRTVLVTYDAPTSFRLAVWDVVTGTELANWDAGTDFPGARPNFETLSRDGRLLAVSFFVPSGPELRREVVVWDLAQNRYRFRRSDLNRPLPMAFSPDGRFLALAGPELPVTLLDVEDGTTRWSSPGHTGQVWDLAFSPDGRWLASAGGDQTLRIWDVDTGRSLDVMRGHESSIGTVRWDADNSRLFTGGEDGTVREWRFPREPRVVLRGGFWAELLGDVMFAPDSSHVVVTTAAGAMARIDPATLAPIGEPWTGAFQPLGFGPDGVRALNRNLELVIVNPADGTIRPGGLAITRPEQLLYAASSPDGHYSALGFNDGAVQFWDLAAGQAITPPAASPHDQPIWALAVSAGGRWAASGDRTGRVWLWEAAAGRPVREITASGAPVGVVEFSPDATRLLVGRADGAITVVNTATFAAEVELAASPRGVSALAFSPDGTRLVAGGLDGLVTVWSVPEFRQLALLSLEPSAPELAHRAIFRLRFAPDGRSLLAMTEDGSLRRWDLR